MKIINRWYQNEAIDAAMKSDNGVICASTGCGKSVIISGIVQRLYPAKILILQPSAEILGSNIRKVQWAGLENVCAYSQTYGEKEICDVTYATIKSIVKKVDGKYQLMKEFRDYDYLIIDECELVDSAKGQYKKLIEDMKPKKLIGLTATPYRQHGTRLPIGREGELIPAVETRLITRTRPRIFKEIIYFVGTGTLIDQGYLVDPIINEIFSDDRLLVINSTAKAYTKDSITLFIEENDIVGKISNVVRDIKDRFSSILVFAPDVETALLIEERLLSDGVSAMEVNAKTKKKERARRLEAFERGEYQVAINVKALSRGWDCPMLEVIIDASPTRSPALHYQKWGRVVRPYENKKAMIVDMAGNLKRLGNPLRYEMRKNNNGTYDLYDGDRKISPDRLGQDAKSMKFQRVYHSNSKMPYGKHKGKLIKDLPQSYIQWMVDNANIEKGLINVFKSELIRRDDGKYYL